MKTCSIEGCQSPVFSKGLCHFHSPKKRLNSSLRLTKSSTIKYKPKVAKYTEEDKKALIAFYKKIWGKRLHVSEISGEKILFFSSVNFHHILPKRTYKEAIFDEENIILLTFVEHSNIEINPTRYEEINRRKEILQNKYRNYN